MENPHARYGQERRCPSWATLRKVVVRSKERREQATYHEFRLGPTFVFDLFDDDMNGRWIKSLVLTDSLAEKLRVVVGPLRFSLEKRASARKADAA